MKEAALSRVKKLVCAAVLMFGVVGFTAGPASALLVHEEITLDSNDLNVPPAGGLLSLCLGVGSGPLNCVRI